MTRFAHGIAGLLITVTSLAMTGCVEQTVKSRSGWGTVTTRRDLHALQHETPSGGANFERLLEAEESQEFADDTDDHPLRVTSTEGEVTLILRSPRHVMLHTVETIRNEEFDLLYDQVLSQATKDAYKTRGRDPREAVDYLMENRDEIEKLFLSMPAGELTPGVFMRNIGRNQYRLEAPGGSMLDQKFRALDVAIEGGRFRLLMLQS